MNKGRKKQTPLPKAKSFVVVLAIFIEGVLNSVLLPFIAYMVADFFYWLDRNDKSTDGIVSLYSGLLVSSFNLAQFLSAPFWGIISDKYGRRPTLLIGMLGNAFTAPLLGLAPNYTWAIIFRSLNGLINGNATIFRAYAAEITDDTNSSKLFSYLGIAWGLGTTVGPIIGGTLSRISDKIPSIFSPSGFWGQYPYFLPTLANSFVSLFIFTVGYFSLYETKKKSKRKISPCLLTKNSKFLLCAAIHSIGALIFSSFNEVFTFWCRALKINGGLEWNSEADIGIVQSFGGASIILFQTFIVPSALNYFGILQWIKVAWVILIIDFLMLPNIHVFGGWSLWIAIIVLYIFFASTQASVFTSVTLGVNHSVDYNYLGAANGIAQSSVSLCRFIGPALAGTIFGWSLNSGLGYPLNSHFIFIIFAIFGLVCIIFAYGLDESINRRKTESDSMSPLLNKDEKRDVKYHRII
ncbi:unnamed protein product [Blepharisma stoltei]|uniref:Major facilitator superfamily (MFS) profile domain-containing protein n=1 Tax=Blepharisma stoltei TaxID=1481888 RepID=A0AAU9KBG9_9CILI|nr:unnamed protein product [Blepharisma stoltei]